MKECRQCRLLLPATTEYFSRQSALRDGLANYCKTCSRANSKKYFLSQGWVSQQKKATTLPEQAQQAKILYMSGLTQSEVGQRLGVTGTTVSSWLKAIGVLARSNGPQLDINTIADRYISGETLQHLAVEFNTTAYRLKKVLIANGIELHQKTAAADGQPRQCSYCGLEYPATGEYFTWAGSAHTSLSRMCRKCDREQSRETMQKSRERHPESNKPYQLKLKAERAVRIAQRQAERLDREVEKERARQEKSTQEYAEREASRLVKEQKRIFAHTCIDCGLVDFSRNRSRRHKDGFRCATCGAVYNKKAKAERKADYYAAHPDRKNAEKRRWEETHPVEHHAQRIAHDSKRRARSLGLIAEYHLTDYGKMLDYWCNSCAYCGGLPGRFDEHQTFHSEHFIPLSPGYDLAIANPGTVPGNMLPACAKCNLDKRNQDPYLWTVKRFGRKRGAEILARIETYFAQIK